MTPASPRRAGRHLRRVLQPVALLVTDEGGDGLVAHAVNDTARAMTVQLGFTAWRDGEVRVATGSRLLELPARGACSVPLVALLDHFMDLNHAWRFGPPACELLQVRLLDAQGAELAAAFHFPLGLAPLVSSPRLDLGLQTRLTPQGDGAQLEIVARHWAVGVHVDVPGWMPDDNHFHLAPGSARTLALRRVREQAALAGSLHALNLATALPIEVCT